MPKTTILTAEEIEALDDEALAKYTAGIKRDKAVAEAQELSSVQLEADKKIIKDQVVDSDDDPVDKNIEDEAIKLLEADEANK